MKYFYLKIIYLKRYIQSYVEYCFSYLRFGSGGTEFNYFPFDIHRPLPDEAINIMNELCLLVESTRSSYRLTDGTFLGLYREGKFIDHDNDIDIDILGNAEFESLHQKMIDNGMILGRRVFKDGLIQQAAYYNSDHIIFDILFWYEDGKEIVNYSEPGYIRRQPKKYFLNLDTFILNGRSYPVPSEPEDWLEMRYGRDWHIPKTYKGDWKDECHDIEKA